MQRQLLAIALPLVLAAAPSAQIDWRVSVKFILDANGNRAAGNVATNADVQSQIDLGNEALRATGRGIQLRLVDIVDLDGAASIFNLCDVPTLQLVADTNPASIDFRTNAINIYVTGATCAGQCSFPDSGDDVIIVGTGARTTTFIHEIGHFMGLCHTQGCPCGSCDGGVNTVCDDIPGDDEIPDTVPDLACWSQDQIANNAFGANYAMLTPNQQNRVDNSWLNVMSYHTTRNRFTDDQMDVMTTASNGPRSNVATGRTIFVDGSVILPLQNGSVLFPFRSVGSALSASSSGDIVLIRPGTYAAPVGPVSGEVALRWTRGSVTIQ